MRCFLLWDAAASNDPRRADLFPLCFSRDVVVFVIFLHSVRFSHARGVIKIISL